MVIRRLLLKFEVAQKAFEIFDSGKSGKISFTDLKKIAKELGENMTDEEI